VSDITLNDTININKGEIKDQGLAAQNIRLSQTGTGFQAGEITIGAGVTVDLPVDNLTTPGRYVIQLTEVATGASLQVGPDNGGSILPMDEVAEAGEPIAGRVSSGVTIKLKAISGQVKANCFVAEE